MTINVGGFNVNNDGRKLMVLETRKGPKGPGTRRERDREKGRR